MIEWIAQNKEWFFSGVGASIVIAILTWLFKKDKRNHSVTQKITSGDYSSPILAGRDVTFINSEIRSSKINTKTINLVIDAIERNAKTVELLKEQYDKITKPSIDFMPRYFLDLDFLKSAIEQKHEALNCLPSPEIVYQAISSLSALDKTLETLRSISTSHRTLSREHQPYQLDIIFQCKEHLSIAQSLLLKAQEVLKKKDSS